MSLATYAKTPTETLSLQTETVVVPSFMGFGVQLDPYEFPPTEDHWHEIVNRLDILKPAFLRVMFDANSYCLRMDERGCAEYIWRGSPAPNSQYSQILRILDYAESRRIPVMIGEWSWPRLPHDKGVSDIKDPSDPRWAEIIAPFLVHLIQAKHYTMLRYYNYMNEPNGGWMWPGGRAGVNYDAWGKGYVRARHIFDAAGLQEIALVGPDNSGDWDWIDKAVHDTKTATGGWEMHWYPTDDEVTSGDVYRLLRSKKSVIDQGDPSAASKPLYLGEAGLITGRIHGDQQPRVRTFLYGVRMADYAAQVAQAGWMGASAWDLDDAMHAVSKQHPAVPDALTLKTWGFWNSAGPMMGTPEDFAIRPWFHLWTSLTHSFPPGSRIVAVSDPDSAEGIRAIASEYKLNGRQVWNVMLVNDHNVATVASLDVAHLTGLKWRTYEYRSDDYAENASAPARVQHGRINVRMRPYSVTFLRSEVIP